MATSEHALFTTLYQEAKTAQAESRTFTVPLAVVSFLVHLAPAVTEWGPGRWNLLSLRNTLIDPCLSIEQLASKEINLPPQLVIDLIDYLRVESGFLEGKAKDKLHYDFLTLLCGAPVREEPQ